MTEDVRIEAEVVQLTADLLASLAAWREYDMSPYANQCQQVQTISLALLALHTVRGAS